MLLVTLKSLLDRKLRLVMTILAIVLGVSFVAASLMFTNLLSRSLDEIVQSTVGDINVVPTGGGTTGFTTNTNVSEQKLTSQEIERIAEVPGVGKTTGIVSSTGVYLLDTNDQLVAIQGAPGIGANWHQTPAAGGLSGIRLVSGKAPDKDGEIVVDPNTLHRSGHQLGDQVEVSTPFAGIQTFTLVGTGTYGSGATAGASYLFFTKSDAQRIFIGGEDAYSSMWITVEPGTDIDDVAARVEDVLPSGWQVQTGDEMAKQIEDLLATGMGFVNALLLVFAGIALLIATLLILNTFSILLAHRERELALLRAMGATRRQVRQCVLAEATLIGLIGAILGIVAGYAVVWGLRGILSALGVDTGDAKPQLTWQIALSSLSAGIAVTVLAALVPAVHAGRTRPIEALSNATHVSTAKEGSQLAVVGIILIEFATALIVCGTLLDVPHPLWWVGAGCALLLLGCVLTISLLGRPVLWLSGKVFQRIFGEVGHLAERNARRQPRRTAATAATLTIGFALVATVAVLASSVTTSLRTQLSADQRGDFVVASVDLQPFDVTAEAAVAAVNGVEWVASFTPAQANLKGTKETVSVLGTTTRGFDQGSTVKMLAGELDDEADAAVVTAKFADEHGLSLGRMFTLDGTIGSAALLVTGIADDASAPVILQRATLEKVASVQQVTSLVVFMKDGADATQVRSGLLSATKDYKTVSVSDVQEYVQTRVDQFQQIVALIYALLGLALMIAVLGIVNTLSLSVIERTREIGLLRAVGLTRKQIRRMISLESLIITVIGAVLGVLLGLLFGWLIQIVNRDHGIGTLHVPWLQLLLFIFIAAVVGWLAAIGPARRAARMPVLMSITA